MRPFARIVWSTIVVSFLACGKAPVLCEPDSIGAYPKPEWCPDRASLGFAQEFGSGTYIGTAPVESLSVRNGGLADLSITDGTYTGDSAFTITASWATDGGFPATTVKGNESIFVQVAFAPTQAKLYTGTLTLNNTSANEPVAVIQISGCGVPNDGGTTPCYRDGGAP
jgi:hypothetical protein